MQEGRNSQYSYYAILKSHLKMRCVQLSFIQTRPHAGAYQVLKISTLLILIAIKRYLEITIISMQNN